MPSDNATQYRHGNGPRHYYKSGWADKKGKLGIKSQKRWIQLRHFVIYYFPEEQSGYNSWVSWMPLLVDLSTRA